MLLEEFLRPTGLTQVEAARRMGTPLNRLNKVVRGKRGVTADTALRLARLLTASAELWLGLQHGVDHCRDHEKLQSGRRRRRRS